MKKYFIVFISIALLFLTLVVVNSLTISPDTGTFYTNTNTTFDIGAQLPGTTPVSTIDRIIVEIAVTGGTITGYTDPSGVNVTAAPNCSGGTKYTASKICVDLTRGSGYFTESEDLGSITVHWSAAGNATLESTDNTLYIDTVNEDTFPFAEALGSYTISNTTNTPTPTASPTPTGRIPETALDTNSITIMLGVTVCISGLLLYKYASNHYKTNE